MQIRSPFSFFRLNCHVTGHPTPTFTWHVNGILVKPSKKFEILRGVNEVTLIVHNVQDSDAGEYILKAENDLGVSTIKSHVVIDEFAPTEPVVTQTATQELKIAPPMPRFTEILPPIMHVHPNKSMILSTKVEKQIPVIFKWYHEGLEITPSPNVHILNTAETSELRIDRVQDDDKGHYICEVTSPEGHKIKTTCTIDFVEPSILGPHFKEPLKSSVTIIPSKPLPVLHCSIEQDEDVPMEEVEFHWYLDGKQISPETMQIVKLKSTTTGTSELQFIDFSPEYIGTYTCEAVSHAGRTASSCHVDLQLETPIISAKPKQAEMPPRFKKPLKPKLKVPKRTTVVLECEVEAVPSANFRWYMNGVAVDNSRQVEVRLGDNKSELVLHSVEPHQSGDITVEAISPLGRAVSVCRLEVMDTPEELKFVSAPSVPHFVRPLSPLIVVSEEVSKRLTFSIDLSEPQPEEVKWFVNGIEIQPSDRALISQEDRHSELVLEAIKIEDIGEVSVEAIYPQGKLMSRCEVLTPKDEDTVEKQKMVSKAEITPQFTQPLPQQATITQKSTTTLDCVVKAYPPAAFKWFVDGQGVEVGSDFEIKDTVNKSELIIHNVPKETSEITVEVSTPHSRVTNVCNLEITPTPFEETVKIVPNFIEPLIPRMTVPEKSTAVLVCKVDSVPQEVKWFVNSFEVKPSEKYTILTDKTKHVSELLVHNVTPKDEGAYVCEVTVATGKVQTECHLEVGKPQEILPDTGHVTVSSVPLLQAPVFLDQLQDHSVVDGDDISMTCVVDGVRPLTIEWFHDGLNITESEDFVISFDDNTGVASLFITEVFPEDRGVYKCVVQNEFGISETVSELHVVSSEVPEDSATANTQITVQQSSTISLVDSMTLMTDSNATMSAEVAMELPESEVVAEVTHEKSQVSLKIAGEKEQIEEHEIVLKVDNEVLAEPMLYEESNQTPVVIDEVLPSHADVTTEVTEEEPTMELTINDEELNIESQPTEMTESETISVDLTPMQTEAQAVPSEEAVEVIEEVQMEDVEPKQSSPESAVASMSRPLQFSSPLQSEVVKQIGETLE